MALYSVPMTGWTAPIILAQRSFVQVQSGWPVLVATEAPADLNDGAILRDEKGIILGAGVVLRFRADGLTDASVYVGRVE